jgi:glycosyltransferase involved in cell wall biosynthesis
VAFLRSLDVFLYQIPKNSYSAVDGVVQDAMMCELPVVLMGGSGPKELIEHGKSGIIANNRKELVKYCMDLYRSVDLRRAMGKEARKRILSHFDLKHTVELYVRLYDDIRCRNRASLKDGKVRHMNMREKLLHIFRLVHYLPEWLWRKLVT